MRKYFEYVKNAFKESLAYRVEYFMGITQSLFLLLVQLYLWRALLGQSEQASTDMGVITLNEMTTYVLMSTIIATLIYSNVILNINDRIRNGQISMDLIKPVNFKTYMFCNMIGRSFFNFLFQLLPVLAIGLIFIGIDYPSMQNLLLFCVTLVNAIIIMFLIQYSLGLLAFWYMSMWQVEMLLWTLIRLFSGQWIPLWFFPKILVNISNFLPFRLMYFVPISIYLGKVELVDSMYLLIQQLIWIVVLFGMTRLMWRAAIKKLVIQGG